MQISYLDGSVRTHTQLPLSAKKLRSYPISRFSRDSIRLSYGTFVTPRRADADNGGDARHLTDIIPLLLFKPWG